MSKLHFKYGAMNSGKSDMLIKTAYNYEERGLKVIVVKPKIDTKGDDYVIARGGHSRKVDICANDTLDLAAIAKSTPDIACILVDKAQFLVFNTRKVNGSYMFEGGQVAIDGEGRIEYDSLCGTCYMREGGEI